MSDKLWTTEEVMAKHLKLLNEITTRHNFEIGRLYERVRKLEERADAE